MFDDAFTAISRDGAGAVEVMLRLQKALESLASLGDRAMREAAMAHARLALARAEKGLDLAEELALVRDVAASPGHLDANPPATPPNKALQLTWHSVFESESGSLFASTLGASATVGGLRHAAERPIRWAARKVLPIRFDRLRDLKAPRLDPSVRGCPRRRRDALPSSNGVAAHSGVANPNSASRLLSYHTLTDVTRPHCSISWLATLPNWRAQSTSVVYSSGAVVNTTKSTSESRCAVPRG